MYKIDRMGGAEGGAKNRSPGQTQSVNGFMSYDRKFQNK